MAAHDDSPLTDRERAFLELQQQPRAFAAWAAEVRAQWERERGVEWLHQRAGHPPVWRSTRPAPDPHHVPLMRFNPERAARYAAKAKQQRQTG